MNEASSPADRAVWGPGAFTALFVELRRRGYTIIGPKQADGAIVYEELESSDHLPAGLIDDQDAGSYRLRQTDSPALFDYVVGPHSWKKYLQPPELKIWGARRTDNGGFEIERDLDDPPRYAFIGARPCEIAAISIQDKIFLEGAYVDPVYAARREGIFIVAVNCGRPGGTCFCVSMNSGPRVSGGFDLALTELVEDGGHRLVVEVGSDKGAEVLAATASRPATEADLAAAAARSEAAAKQMGRELDTDGLPELLVRNAEHPHWQDVASRCESCANCTMVCPTCFCHTVTEVNDLKGDHSERWRKWDSCFTSEFSYIHGGAVRKTVAGRYRHWITHKLSTWKDQFGTLGCTGCGRCVTWCPVGIDITTEARAIRETDCATTQEKG